MELSFAQLFEGFAITINLIVMWVVSIAILRRYLETKYPPALLAASAFLVLGFIFTPLLLFSVIALQTHPDLETAAWLKTLTILNINAFVIGQFLFAVFTRQVFRPGRRGSLLFVIFIGILLFGSKDLILMFDAKGGMMQWNARFGARLIYVIGNTLNYSWLAYESLGRWSLYRRQLRGGKELDPLVVNRFLLWGLAGVSYAVSTLATILHLPYVMVQPLFPTMVKAAFILAFAIFSYLSWSPPGWYKRIIRKGKPARA